MTRKIISFFVWIIGFLLLVGLLSQLFLKTSGFGYEIFSNKAKDDPARAVESAITIRENESLIRIGKDLERKGIVRNAYVFAATLWTMDDRDRIVPGEYNVSSAQKPSEILKIFTADSENDDAGIAPAEGQ